MPIARFTHEGHTRLGKISAGRILDLSVAAPDLPRTLADLLAAGPAALERVRGLAPGQHDLGVEEVRLEAPLPEASKFLAIGMNYRQHAAEVARAGGTPPTGQMWFNKQVSCITGPFDAIVRPRVSAQLDYEVELGVVIGRRCRHVAAQNAAAVIGGYLVCNDVSIRDWQRASPTITLGKSFDSHGPTGPWLALAEEIADPHALGLRMLVNGELRQQANTDDMIHSIFAQIAHLSTVMTLMPGDILATGTPSGVGVLRNPPTFLQAGDIVRAEIDCIGYIENRVVNEADA
jgi:2-keto-4-pentenoate hydratase/2-oxohepta-3-ene-1,7-dioic acid hydratase in catechol pathway